MSGVAYQTTSDRLWSGAHSESLNGAYHQMNELYSHIVCLSLMISLPSAKDSDLISLRMFYMHALAFARRKVPSKSKCAYIILQVIGRILSMAEECRLPELQNFHLQLKTPFPSTLRSCYNKTSFKVQYLMAVWQPGVSSIVWGVWMYLLWDHTEIKHECSVLNLNQWGSNWSRVIQRCQTLHLTSLRS